MDARRRMLITAGPTHEPIDAVRYLANRSSGRLGLALAEAARAGGWDVTLLLGPTPLSPPAGVTTARFESTADLERLLDAHLHACDVLVMAAAVADYRPRHVSDEKQPRMAAGWTLELESTPDLLARCAARRRPGQTLVGFALEAPAALAARAQAKLRAKGVDAIVANPLATMGAEAIQARIFTADGQIVTPPAETLDKQDFARWFVAWVAEWVERRSAGT